MRILNNDQLSRFIESYSALSRYSQDNRARFLFFFFHRNTERKRTSYVVRCSRLRARSCSF